MNPWEHTIIIVEDEADELALLKLAFQKANIKNPIQVFRDGQEVMDYLSKMGSHSRVALSDPPPALMLLDLKMPRKTGFEVLEWLRYQPRLKCLVVVMMANSLEMTEINRAYELGCNSYLSKPGSIDRLVEMVSLIYNYWLLLNVSPDLRYTPNPFLPP
jgi:CheY-like chemotaxis protein